MTNELVTNVIHILLTTKPTSMKDYMKNLTLINKSIFDVTKNFIEIYFILNMKLTIKNLTEKYTGKNFSMVLKDTKMIDLYQTRYRFKNISIETAISESSFDSGLCFQKNKKIKLSSSSEIWINLIEYIPSWVNHIKYVVNDRSFYIETPPNVKSLKIRFNELPKNKSTSLHLEDSCHINSLVIHPHIDFTPIIDKCFTNLTILSLHSVEVPLYASLPPLLRNLKVEIITIHDPYVIARLTNLEELQIKQEIKSVLNNKQIRLSPNLKTLIIKMTSRQHFKGTYLKMKSLCINLMYGCYFQQMPNLYKLIVGRLIHKECNCKHSSDKNFRYNRLYINHSIKILLIRQFKSNTNGILDLKDNNFLCLSVPNIGIYTLPSSTRRFTVKSDLFPNIIEFCKIIGVEELYISSTNILVPDLKTFTSITTLKLNLSRIMMDMQDLPCSLVSLCIEYTGTSANTNSLCIKNLNRNFPLLMDLRLYLPFLPVSCFSLVNYPKLIWAYINVLGISQKFSEYPPYLRGLELQGKGMSVENLPDSIYFNSGIHSLQPEQYTFPLRKLFYDSEFPPWVDFVYF
ncbi:hypothetical protein EON71_00960 [bacterium]|nr:MAG: hypothetical protein EON71_00960 [bacterium]